METELIETRNIQIHHIERYESFLECLVSENREKYEIIISPTNGNSVLAIENVEQYFEPISSEKNPERNSDHPYNVVIPLQSAGSCAACCSFCNYGQEDMSKYASPETIVELLRTGINIAIENEMITNANEVKFSLLKGGEISLHPNFEEVLESIYNEYPNTQLKISTIGSKKLDFFPRIIKYQRQHPNHNITLQISANSSDHNQRIEIVNKENSTAIDLYTFEEISYYSKLWRQVSNNNRLLTITFTLTDTTICNVQELTNELSSEDVVFRLRRMHPKTDTGQELSTISKEDYINLYTQLSNANFVVISGNPSYDEIKHNLIQGKNFILEDL